MSHTLLWTELSRNIPNITWPLSLMQNELARLLCCSSVSSCIHFRYDCLYHRQHYLCHHHLWCGCALSLLFALVSFDFTFEHILVRCLGFLELQRIAFQMWSTSTVWQPQYVRCSHFTRQNKRIKNWATQQQKLILYNNDKINMCRNVYVLQKENIHIYWCAILRI